MRFTEPSKNCKNTFLSSRKTYNIINICRVAQCGLFGSTTVQFRSRATNNYQVRYLRCTKTKQSFARIAEKSSFSLQVSRNFMQKKDLKMSRSVAESAVLPVNRAEAASANSTQQCAESAAARQEFPLNPRATEAYFAVLALRKQKLLQRNNSVFI